MAEKHKIIIFGTSTLALEAIDYYGKKNIAYIVDNYYPMVKTWGDIEVIPFCRLKQIYNQFKVVVAIGHHSNYISVCSQLEDEGIPYTSYNSKVRNGLFGDMIYIHGTCPDLVYETNPVFFSEERMKPTMDLFTDCFDRFKDVFKGKEIRVFIYVGDSLTDAYRIMKMQKLSSVFAYSTIDVFKNIIIPIPDYRTCFDEKKYYYEESPGAIKTATQKPYEDSRLYFKGTNTRQNRLWLKILADMYPEKIFAEVREGYFAPEEKTPMLDYVKYKYLLGMEGSGWTDREKILLQLKRPLFLTERAHKEWFYDRLFPMEHYVPVKSDLSDLIEKYDYLENHPESYEHIVSETELFVKEVFSIDNIMNYLKEVIMSYGIS